MNYSAAAAAAAPATAAATVLVNNAIVNTCYVAQHRLPVVVNVILERSGETKQKQHGLLAEANGRRAFQQQVQLLCWLSANIVAYLRCYHTAAAALAVSV